MAKRRDSNMELLRIFAMFLIVWNHFLYHGPWDKSVLPTLLVLRTFTFGKVGVNIFVMISGYYLINSRFKSRSLTRIFAQLLFYAPAIAIVGKCIGVRHASLGLQGLNAWFAWVYACMYFCIPFMNTLVKAISLRSYRMLLIFIAVLYALGFVLPHLGLDVTLGEGLMGDGTELPCFCFLYLLGGYIRKSGLDVRDKKLIALFAVSIVLLVLSRVVLTILAEGAEKGSETREFLKHFLEGNHESCYPAVLLFSAAIFFAFKNMHIPYNAKINALAGTTFGIYLIHDNPLIRQKLWHRFSSLQASPALLFFGTLAVSACVFIVCAIIEYGRQVMARKLKRLRMIKIPDSFYESFDRVMVVK